MHLSKVLSDKRLEEIKKLPVTFDDDLPEFKDEDLKGFDFAHPEYFEIKTKNAGLTENFVKDKIIRFLKE